MLQSEKVGSKLTKNVSDTQKHSLLGHLSPVWAKKLKYKYPIKAIAIYIEQQLFEPSFRSLSAFDIQDNKGGEDLSSNNEMFHKMAKSGNCQVLKANNNQNVNIWDKAQRRGKRLKKRKARMTKLWLIVCLKTGNSISNGNQ